MLNGIIISTSNTLQSIYYLMPSGSPGLNKYKMQIEDLDLDFKLQIIKDWLNKETTVSLESTKSNEFNKIKNGIGESCIKISNILDEINKEISYHSTKYFSSYRTLDLTEQITKLIHHNKIMNERILLINLV
jgi:hypothetical protein